MHRRRFLQSSAAAVGGVVLGPTALRVAEAARRAGVPDTLGIQLYSLRDVLPGDVNGVLEMLARYGYGEVETAGYADLEPAVFAAALDAHGLTAPSAHQMVAEVVAGSESMADAGLPAFDAALETVAAVGHGYLVIPWLPPDARPDRDGYLALADLLNDLGERSQAAGVQLGYHNHDFEFDTFGGGRPAYFDFVERLDPDLVVLELDLYWAHVAGYDPVEIFERYPGRFPLWHVKDGAGPDMAQTAVGAGVIDWPRIFAASGAAGLRHAFVEADTPPAGSLAFAQESIDYLTSLRD
ncbi:sugar phosphate isomerase/epimerase family protein [Rubrivirga litoralis]|uniref:Sugar phosphate isomerase/epimerase n=1 Tax=Rubrivirga litoralis TaxID=3075598 RepID=A0ABU3BLT4_9BACT|nr:sugar phosphate isomerase/epimerase [Rubrivirga sp. F394]MDT0630254.1 sugar phosphate isomerase/epimerase [Rubrivirga sp. F394]